MKARTSLSSDVCTFDFAAAMPPRAEAMFPTDRWLNAVAGAGYTHLCLQNDPFFHPEMDLRDTGENTFRLLSLYDMTAGPRQRAYRQWLEAVDARAAVHGLKLAMELWEPRLTRLSRQNLPADWKGPALAGGWVEPLCVSHAEARAWLLEKFRVLVRTALHLDALILGINDNNAVLCGDECPRCAGRSAMERLGELYADIGRACRDVRPEMRLIPYDWMWNEAHYRAVFSRLSGKPAILTRMERNADHTPDQDNPQWHGMVYDESVGCDGLGDDFRMSQRIMRESGGEVVVMPTLSGMFECFHLPYVPAAGQMARKFARMRAEKVAGWVDYDCGGIHEGLMLDLVDIVQHNGSSDVDGWLDTLALRRYGTKQAAMAARQIWGRFDMAVKLWPAQLEVEGINGFSGRFAMAMGLLPLHPMLPERLAGGAEAAMSHFHFDPHVFARPNALPAVRTLVDKARRTVDDATMLYEQLVTSAASACREAAELDRDIALMTLLNWRSVANFFEWAAARYGDNSVDLAVVLADEIETTRRFREFAIRPELGYGNMTWHPERCVAMSVPQASADLWRQVEVNRCAAWKNQPFPQKAGNLWDWRIAHLERQLDEARTGRLS